MGSTFNYWLEFIQSNKTSSVASKLHLQDEEIERLTAKCAYKDEVIDQRNVMLTREEEKVAQLEDIIATHADPTGDDEDTIALILQCVENWSDRDAPASGPLDSFHVFPEGTVFSDEEEDPTPWCHVCMARSHMECTCLPIAENN